MKLIQQLDGNSSHRKSLKPLNLLTSGFSSYYIISLQNSRTVFHTTTDNRGTQYFQHSIMIKILDGFLDFRMEERGKDREK